MKRLLVLLCLVFMLCVFAGAEPIYKYEDTTPITDTVSLTKVREFYSDHNISYSYIKFDLSDERVKLKLLTSDKGTDVLEYMSELAKTDENTVAALNADFFSVYSGNKGFSLGIEKEDGKVLQSPISPDTMATVAYDGSNILMTYLDFHVFAVSEEYEHKEIRHVNKHTSYYGDLLMYTHEFGAGYSPAPGGDVVEVVIEDDIVTEFRRNMEPCKIPENGCVLVLSEGSSMFLDNTFDVGDKIHFDWYFTPSLDDFDTAFGAGSMLVSEGQDVGKVGDYTHTVSGFNPRSAMGIDKEGKTLYLVAVDGRQESSRGMRMSHLAELMIELGCYTAVNLDGGGSTRMLASTLWDSDMHPVNNPTENRKVINAIGIVLSDSEQKAAEQEEAAEEKTGEDTQEESGETNEKALKEGREVTEDEFAEEVLSEKEVSGIKIRAEREILFVGEKVKLEVVLHDEQLRSVPFDVEEIEFHISEGKISEDLEYVCDIQGDQVIGVSFGDFYAETSVYYIDSISGIYTESVLRLKKGESFELPIYVFDYTGRSIKVKNTELFEISSSDPNVAVTEQNVITALDDGTAVVTISKDSVVFNVSVAVGTYSYKYLYDFEYNAGGFVGYPDETKGSFELSDDYSVSGKLSGKLNFDFTDDSQLVMAEDSEEHEAVETVEGLQETYETESALKDEETSETQETETEETETDNITTQETEVSEPEITDTETSNTEIVENDVAQEAAELLPQTDDISRAVYFSLFEKVLFDKEKRIVTIKVYGPEEFRHEVRGQLIYGNGKVKNVKFDGEVLCEEWSTLTLEVPQELDGDVYLSRIYVLFTPGEEKDKSCIYIDDISLITNKEHTPENPGKNVYRYTKNNSNVDAKVKISAISEVDDGNYVSLFETSKTKNLVLGENGLVISDKIEKSVFEDDYCVYVNLDTSNGGIRNTDSSQWELIEKAHTSSTRKNMFIITNDSIFGKDEFENEVICDYLASLDKDVYVVSKGNAATYLNINGVKYFTLDATPKTRYSFLEEQRSNTIEFAFGDFVTFNFINA